MRRSIGNVALTQPQATICLPSNRALSASRASLESAIAYAEWSGCRLVISDNSRDPKKAAFLAGHSPRLTYLADGPENAADNMLSAFEVADTEFVMPMGDDDLIFPVAGREPFDFSTVPDDHVAIKPSIEIIGQDGRCLRMNSFALQSGDPAGRMLDYARMVQGDNSTYYSFVRRANFMPICRLFTRHHPTRAGSTDWPMVMAMIAEGKYATDPSSRYCYALGQWQTTAGIASANDMSARKAGLPPDAPRYTQVFHFLDFMGFVMRRSSPLSPADRHRAISTASVIFLRNFVRAAHRQPRDFELCSDLVPAFIAALSVTDHDPELLFSLATQTLERLKPGLKAGYEAFLSAAQSDVPAGIA